MLKLIFEMFAAIFLSMYFFLLQIAKLTAKLVMQSPVLHKESIAAHEEDIKPENPRNS